MGFEPEQGGPSSGPGSDGDGAARRGRVAARRGRPARAPRARPGRPCRWAWPAARAGRARRSSPAALEIAEEANKLLEEANANTQALIDTIGAIIRAETIDEVVAPRWTRSARSSAGRMRRTGWWNPAENALVFSLESGRVDDEFQRLTRTARFREGEGLNGRSWRLRDLFHVADVGELHDCCRAPLARRAGIRTAVALPVLRDGQVVGTLDFFADAGRGDLRERLAALRMIGRLSSDKFSKLARQGELVRIQQMIENAPVNVMYADRDLKLLLHEPDGDADPQEAGAVPAGEGRADDRPVARHLPQGNPSTSAGCWPTRGTCRTRRRSGWARNISS